MARLGAAGWLCVGGLSMTACGGGSAGAASSLPPYTGHSVQLFDDAIEPVAVGFPPLDDALRPASDSRLRERTQTGDTVVRARVLTASAKVEDRGRSWQLTFHTLERLGGGRPLDEDFTVAIAPDEEANGLVASTESRLVGKTFIVFVREFGHDGLLPGEHGDLRFHVAPDSREEKDAVIAAQMLR